MISDNIFGMKSAHKHAPSRAHVISLCFCGNIWWRVSSYFSAVCLNDQQTPGNYNIIIFPRLHIGYALASLGGNHQRVQGDRVVSWDCGNVCGKMKKDCVCGGFFVSVWQLAIVEDQRWSFSQLLCFYPSHSLLQSLCSLGASFGGDLPSMKA